jgi:hypothetical protein
MKPNVRQDLSTVSAPTLFLDFDGVLHPNLTPPDQRFSQLPLLVEAIDQSSVEIVISSSWRFEWSLARMKGFFPESLRPRIIGTTGPAYIGRHARWQEINCYCEDAAISNWRALDDARFEFPDPCEQLIACDGGRGLEHRQCELLRLWLGDDSSALSGTP